MRQNEIVLEAYQKDHSFHVIELMLVVGGGNT